MELIKHCSFELEKLSKCKSKRSRAKLIQNYKRCVIDAISEICLNFLEGKLKVSPKNFKKLIKYRKTIETLKKKSPIYKRKRILIQKGGFLNILIPSALFLLEKIFKNVKN